MKKPLYIAYYNTYKKKYISYYNGSTVWNVLTLIFDLHFWVRLMASS